MLFRILKKLFSSSSAAPKKQLQQADVNPTPPIVEWKTEVIAAPFGSGGQAQQVAISTSVSVEVVTPRVLSGRCYVVDGDTINIGKVSLRLAGIDAPELDHPWGQQAKWYLAKLCKGQEIKAEVSPELSYDRLVATCYLPDGRDLSAEMVKAGLALDWPKFSGGKYAELEPAGSRKKHWKVAARQRGHMSVFNK